MARIGGIDGRAGVTLVAISPPQAGELTRPQEADSEIQRLTDRLIASERMALVGQATAQIAHHLTSQLNILPLIHLMEREYAQDVQLAEFLALFRESYHQIHETVQQIRRVVRFESIDAPTGPVALGECIRELAAFLRHQKNFPWSLLRLDLRNDSVVLSNRVKLHHILVNLLYNAADAISGREDGRIQVRLAHDVDRVRIDIEDNGRGIPAALISRIWDPSFSTKVGATHGLGLHLVKRLVETDGGQVTCRSTVGAQTIFSVSLPMAPSDDATQNGSDRAPRATSVEPLSRPSHSASAILEEIAQSL